MFNYNFGNGEQTKDRHLKHLALLFARCKVSFRLPSSPLVTTPVPLSPFREAMKSKGKGGHRCSCFFLQLLPFYAFPVLQSGSSADFSPFSLFGGLPWSTSFPSNCDVLFVVYHYFLFIPPSAPSFPPLMPPPSVFSGLKAVFTEVPPVWLKGSAVSCGGPAAEPSGTGCVHHRAGPDLLPQKEAPCLTKPCYLHPVHSGILIQCRGTGNNVILFLLMTCSLTNYFVDVISAPNCRTFDRKFCWIFLVGLQGAFGL